MSFEKIYEIRELITKGSFENSKSFREEIINPYESLNLSSTDPEDSESFERELKTLKRMIIQHIEAHILGQLIPLIKQRGDIDQGEVTAWIVDANDFLEPEA